MSTFDWNGHLTGAIGAHGKWKARLRLAIESGSCNIPAAEARRDDACDFGKWLHGTQEIKSSPRYARVRELHRRFHEEVGVLLQDALRGRHAITLDRMGSGSAYARVSSELTREIMAWRDEAK